MKKAVNEFSVARTLESEGTAVENLELRNVIEDLKIHVAALEEEKSKAVLVRDSFASTDKQQHKKDIEELELLEEVKNAFGDLSSLKPAKEAAEDSKAVIEELRADKKKLKEEAKFFAQFIEKQRGIIEGMEEKSAEKAGNCDTEREKRLFEREKHLQFRMHAHIDRQAEVTAHAYFAKKALKNMWMDSSPSLDSGGGAQAALLMTSVQNKEQKGWGIFRDVFGGSLRDVSTNSLDKDGAEMLKKTLPEEVEFEHDIVLPQKELAKAQQEWGLTRRNRLSGSMQDYATNLKRG
jgi:hypothetical protein